MPILGNGVLHRKTYILIMHYYHSKGVRNIVSPNSISFAIDKFDIIECKAQPYMVILKYLLSKSCGFKSLK